MISSKQPNSQVIALVIVTYAVGLAVFAFFAGHTDPSTRTAVILCITNLVSTLVGVGAGILTGQNQQKGPTDPSKLPPGSTVTTGDKEVVQLPPINPEAPTPTV